MKYSGFRTDELMRKWDELKNQYRDKDIPLKVLNELTSMRKEISRRLGDDKPITYVNFADKYITK